MDAQGRILGLDPIIFCILLCCILCSCSRSIGEKFTGNITELFDSNLSAMKNLYNEFFTSNCGSCVAHTTEEECNKHSECNWNGSVCQNK